MTRHNSSPAAVLLSERLSPLQTQSVAEMVADKLRDAILSGKVQRGDRIVEQALASAFAVGQPTMREALSQLAHQGFVRGVAKERTYLTKLSKDDFRKILEVGLPLEILAVAHVAQRHITQAETDELEQTVAVVESAALAIRSPDVFPERITSTVRSAICLKMDILK